jgi:hypothetical protein
VQAHFAIDGGTMYHPSGTSSAFAPSCHSPSTIWYILILADGPTRIGVPSWTNTVRLHPGVDASAHALEASRIGHRIGRRAAAFDALPDPLEESEGNAGRDALKHHAPSHPWRR